MNFEPEGPVDILPVAFFMGEPMPWRSAKMREEEASVPRIAVCFSFAVAWLVLCSPTSARSEEVKAAPMPIAVADFDYTDTSGEPIDQQPEHRARLQAFVSAIRAALERDGRYRVVTLACPHQPCTAGTSPPDELLASATAAGAKRLLYGGIHKMSTLVQNAKVQVVDLEHNKLAFDRLITFRGDNDEAWRRAERFIARDLMSDMAVN
jgi:Protein of unknown function (DUF2380)